MERCANCGQPIEYREDAHAWNHVETRRVYCGSPESGDVATPKR